MSDHLTTYLTPDQTLDEVENKLANFLRNHQEIEMIFPVALGLFVTSRLGLRGANALLVNLLIAGVSRQIFQEFKNSGTKNISQQPQTVVDSPSNNRSSETQITEDCSIIHAVFGRIRLRIPRLSDDPLFSKRLERLLKEDEKVIKVRVNRAAASVAIHYEAQGISDLELGLHLLNLLNRANSEESIHHE